MKKLFVLAIMTVLSVCAFAEDKLHSFQVAAEVSNYKYREPHTMNLKAFPKAGFSIKYLRRSVLSKELLEEDPSFASLEFRYMTGDVDYTGGRFDGTPLSLKGMKDYYIEAGLRIGKEYHLSYDWRVGPYLGLGWRQLTNHLEQGGEGGYLRESRYFYMPLGFDFRYTTYGGWDVVWNGEFDWLIKGSQYSGTMADAVDIGGVTYDLEPNRNSQDDGYGLRTSLKIEKAFGEKIGIFVEPFVRYWHIQNSDIGYKRISGTSWAVEGFYEPKNYTWEYGLKAGVSF